MQPLEWIEHAPVRVAAHAESTASPDAVFAVLADHERWHEWMPSVRKVVALGPREGVGARRRVVVRGMQFDEEFVVWDPGTRWTFSVYDARPAFTRSLVEDCILTPLPNAGTAISYTMYLDPPPATRWLVRLAAPVMRANNTRGMRNLAARAAR